MHSDHKLLITVHKNCRYLKIALFFRHLEFHCQIGVHILEKINRIFFIFPDVFFFHLFYVEYLDFFLALDLARDVTGVSIIIRIRPEMVVTNILKTVLGWIVFLGDILLL
jgi:hypothetical protein